MTPRQGVGFRFFARFGIVVLSRTTGPVEARIGTRSPHRSVLLSLYFAEGLDYLSPSFLSFKETMNEKPSATMPGTVEKIIKSLSPNEPDRAQISVEGADHLYREIRIDNTLTNNNGDEVSLKRGAHVEVTVEAETESTIPHK